MKLNMKLNDRLNNLDKHWVTILLILLSIFAIVSTFLSGVIVGATLNSAIIPSFLFAGITGALLNDYNNYNINLIYASANLISGFVILFAYISFASWLVFSFMTAFENYKNKREHNRLGLGMSLNEYLVNSLLIFLSGVALILAFLSGVVVGTMLSNLAFSPNKFIIVLACIPSIFLFIFLFMSVFKDNATTIKKELTLLAFNALIIIGSGYLAILEFDTLYHFIKLAVIHMLHVIT